MKPNNRASVSLLSDREITITRTFNAPRELVFKAMTTPELIARWWGPRGSNVVVDQLEVRPGGAWRFLEHSADGNVYGFRGEFREIVPPERVVQTFEFEGLPGHIIVETLTLAEENGITTLTILDAFASQEDRDGMIASGMESGMNESYDKLDELLAELSAASR